MRWPAAAIDRRTLLIGGGVGVGLIVAYAGWPRRAGSPLRGQPGEQVFGPYLRLATNGRLTVAVPQAETGQGSWTALAQIAADELGAAWPDVAVEPAPLASVYANPFDATPTRLTAQSSSVRAFEQPIREAAAMARALLCAAAAEIWKVDPGGCETKDGFVVLGTRRLSFGALADRAAKQSPPRALKRRTPGSGALAGRPLARLDLPAKSDGGLRFAGDVRLPGMRFASLRMAPPGGKLSGYDRDAARQPGVQFVARGDWLAALAETSWAASQALDAVAPRFTGRAAADTPAIDAALDAALAGPMRTMVDTGDYAAAVEGHRPLAASYRIAPAPHLSLEPPAVAARFSGNRLELWAGTQAPDLARASAARAAGLPPETVTLYPMAVGDSGGRAVDDELIAIAVSIARDANAPVMVTMPATTAQNQDSCRPPLAATLSALPDPTGGIATWRARFAGAAGLDAVLARLNGHEVPDFVARGGVPPYAAHAVRVEAATADLPIRTGYWRGDVEALTAFATESFIDELARARGIEPLAFRIGLLGGQPRLARVLSLAAAKGGWDGGGHGSSLGLACCGAFGSFIALLAEASIGADQRVRVTRLVAAVDAGRMINPRLLRQQIEGGLLHSLATVTGPAPEIIAGMPRARPLVALGLSGLKDLPQIHVELVPSTAPSGGASGLGATVLPAAIGNALFAATGLRLRRLPFDPMSPV